MLKPILNLLLFLTLSNHLALAGDCHWNKIEPVISKQATALAGDILKKANFIQDPAALIQTDQRSKKDPSSPSYLNAYGRLVIRFSNGRREHCTANLTDTVPGRSSRIITTAAHCFEYKIDGKFAPDIRPNKIEWYTELSDGSVVYRSAKVLAISETADVAILALNEKVPFSLVKPFLLEIKNRNRPNAHAELFNASITSGGYSGDALLSDQGLTLTYTPDVQMISHSGEYFTLEAVNYQGASGGAAVSDADLSADHVQNPFGQMWLIGINKHVESFKKKNLDTLYRSGGSIGSSKTVVTSYLELLTPALFESFELNEK